MANSTDNCRMGNLFITWLVQGSLVNQTNSSPFRKWSFAGLAVMLFTFFPTTSTKHGHLVIEASHLSMAADESSSGGPYKGSGSLALIVTVIWEGIDLRTVNLDAMDQLRNQFKDLKVVHLISPAYFVRKKQPSRIAFTKVQNQIGAQDGVGINFVPWKSLNDQASVETQLSTTFWGHVTSLKDCDPDCGQDTPWTAYNAVDIRQMVSTQIDAFVNAGLATPNMMRAGGWLATQDLLQAAALKGITTDLSAINPDDMQKEIGRFPLFPLLKAQWTSPKTNASSRSFFSAVGFPGDSEVDLETPAFVMDYATTDIFKSRMKELFTQALDDQGRSFTVHLSLHQETAAKWNGRIRDSLQFIYDETKRMGMPLRSVVPAAAPLRDIAH